MADKSDLLQAQGAYKMRQLNYQLALEDEVKACRNYNELSGRDGEEVSENLEKLSEVPENYSDMNEIICKGNRADLLIAKELLKSAKYAAKEASKRSGPELSVFGTSSLNGLDLSYSEAMSQVTRADKPAYTLGLAFFMPIDFQKTYSVKKGYENDIESAVQSLKKTEIAVKNDWNELSRTWVNVKSRVKLAQEIKSIQTDRVANEQDKSRKGRTTTFLMLNAENDLDDATLNVYRLILEELNIAAQAELYCTTEISE